MLFHSSIRKELARSFVATLVVLVTVVMSMMLIRSLGLAAKGNINPSDVMLLMAYSALGHLGTIMTLSLFIAITSTLSRMYRESEMAVWFSSGRGVASFVGPVLRFAWPILLAIATLALVVWPWSAQQIQKLRVQYEQRGDLERVSAGQFQESANGSRVFFIESAEREKVNTAPDTALSTTPETATNNATATIAATTSTGKTLSPELSQVRNVFISQIEKGKQIITTAKNGRIESINGDQFLVLSKGQRTEQEAQKAEVKVIEFEEYSVLVKAGKVAASVEAPVKSLKTTTLVKKPIPLNLAELSWRLGLALAAINLCIIALLLSSVNPRAGRGFGLVFALLSFVVYYNLLNVGYSKIANGRMQFAHLMLMLHGGIFVFTLLWLTARHWQWSWRHWLPQQIRTTLPTPAAS